MGQITAEYREEKDPIIASGMIRKRLFQYSETLDAWAHQMADIMVRRASEADYEAWRDAGEKLSSATLKMLKDKNIGSCYEKLKAEQVHLIKSIPLDASKRVVDWCKTGLANGERWESITERIQTLGDVSKGRADCIARTETARARSNFTQARAEAIGSKKYIWHTVGDGAVRELHARLDGQVCEWDNPPLCDRPNIHANPGCVFNCRCYAEPLFPEEIDI